jgi:nicotinate-nucleotide pyrophosphorylase (carboxylating)
VFAAREALVVCGAVLLAEIAAAYDDGIATDVQVQDGQRVEAGAEIAVWTGPARVVFTAERVALNFLQRLSGVATATAAYVEAVEGTGAKILDTRKTTPGWRALEKYAVRTGGGVNHRMGLYDAVMVKDNHIAALGGSPADLSGPLAGARSHLPAGGFVQVEVDTLEQLAVALTLPVDLILLDNMSTDELRAAVMMRDEAGAAVELEASGGVTLQTVRAIAETGVERISVGAITHSAPAVDVGLDVKVT